MSTDVQPREPPKQLSGQNGDACYASDLLRAPPGGAAHRSLGLFLLYLAGGCVTRSTQREPAARRCSHTCAEVVTSRCGGVLPQTGISVIVDERRP